MRFARSTLRFYLFREGHQFFVAGGTLHHVPISGIIRGQLVAGRSVTTSPCRRSRCDPDWGGFDGLTRGSLAEGLEIARRICDRPCLPELLLHSEAAPTAVVFFEAGLQAAALSLVESIPLQPEKFRQLILA